MSLEQLIAAWGLPALFAGGLIEGDGAGMIGGAAAHRGAFPFWLAATTLAAGAAVADQGWFFLARAHRENRFVQSMAARPVVQRLLGLLDSRPLLTIASFRFIPGMRTVGPLAIGLSMIPKRLFVPINLASIALWSLIVTGLGYGAGLVIEAALGRLPLAHHMGMIALAALSLVVFGTWLHRHLQSGI